MIPAALLRRFYVSASLRNVEGGFEFRLKNTVAPATAVHFGPVEVDGRSIAEDKITVTTTKPRRATAVTQRAPFLLPLGKVIAVQVESTPLAPGEHLVLVRLVISEVGAVAIEFRETILPPAAPAAAA